MKRIIDSTLVILSLMLIFGCKESKVGQGNPTKDSMSIDTDSVISGKVFTKQDIVGHYLPREECSASSLIPCLLTIFTSRCLAMPLPCLNVSEASSASMASTSPTTRQPTSSLSSSPLLFMRNSRKRWRLKFGRERARLKSSAVS